MVSITTRAQHTTQGGRRRRLILGVTLVVGLLVTTRPLPPVSAASLSFTVNTTADAPDATPGDGVCATAAGLCTLRAAVEEAALAPAGSAISIMAPGRHYVLALGVLTLKVTTISITGAGAGQTTVDGNHVSAVFAILAHTRATLRGLTITGGNAGINSGGGLDNQGSVTLTNSSIVSNMATNGGGLYNDGNVTLINSSVVSNTASNVGGGLFIQGGSVTLINSNIVGNTAASGGGFHNQAGAVTLTNSTISGNTAPLGFGGGFTNDGTVTLTRSTVSGNMALEDGGGLKNLGAVTLTNSTVSGNTAQVGGGLSNSGTLLLTYTTVASNSTGLWTSNTQPGAVFLTGSIVAHSTAGANCTGHMTERAGYNLDSGTSCGFSQPTDITATYPLLGRLANNGGPTETMALRPGSPAIDHGGTSASGCPPTDQRGTPRPRAAACDIGAYERGAQAP